MAERKQFEISNDFNFVKIHHHHWVRTHGDWWEPESNIFVCYVRLCMPLKCLYFDMEREFIHTREYVCCRRKIKNEKAKKKSNDDGKWKYKTMWWCLRCFNSEESGCIAMIFFGNKQFVFFFSFCFQRYR